MALLQFSIPATILHYSPIIHHRNLIYSLDNEGKSFKAYINDFELNEIW